MNPLHFALCVLILAVVSCLTIPLMILADKVEHKVRRIFAARREEEVARINAGWCRTYGHIPFMGEGAEYELPPGMNHCIRCGAQVRHGVDHMAHPAHPGETVRA